jgi:glycosyltransferase involved in cell wall biosynthesis
MIVPADPPTLNGAARLQPARLRVAMLGDYPLDSARIAGGVEAVVSNLVAELSRFDDLEIHVIALREDIAARRVVWQPRLTLHYLPAFYRLGNLTFFLINRLRLRRELARIQPDLIHAHIAGTYAEAAFATGRPTVLTQHGMRYRAEWMDHGWLNRWVRRPLIKREELHSLKQARHLIAISPFLSQNYGHLLRGQVHAIENPIPERFFNLINREVRGRILFAGRVDGNKSVHHVIQALALVRRLNPHAHLHVAGAKDEPGYWDYIQHLITTLGLGAHVQFLGQLSEKRLLEEYARCAVFVLPSRLEMSPMVIQQAMAAGKPVIGSRVGGIPYLVAQAETGFVVDYGDVAAIADALQKVLGDDTLRAALGQRARQEASRRFRASVVAQRTYEVYHQMLAERGDA